MRANIGELYCGRDVNLSLATLYCLTFHMTTRDSTSTFFSSGYEISLYIQMAHTKMNLITNKIKVTYFIITHELAT